MISQHLVNIKLFLVILVCIIFPSLAFQQSTFEGLRCCKNENPTFVRRSFVNPLLSSTIFHHGEEEQLNPPIKVGIVGAGAIAFSTASILSKNGHDVMLWSPSGEGTKDFTYNDDTTTTKPVKLSSKGMMDHKFVPRIAKRCRDLVEENTVLIVALPANGHKRVMDEIAPYLSFSSQKKHVIISSHASLGALYLSQAIEEHQRNDNDNNNRQNTGHAVFPTITAWGTTVCTARRPAGTTTTVDVKSIRKSVDVCTVPEEESLPALKLCETLFPGIAFRSRDGLLAISLSNLNPQNHLGMALGNMSRMEKGESWFQFENTTPNIGRFLEDLDMERRSIANVLGLDVKTIYDHFSLSFHVPDTKCISDMCQQIHNNGNDVYGPNDAESRYITEDVPYGIAFIVALGRLVNRPALLHESGRIIAASMYGRDFAAENELLQALRFDQITLDALQRAARSGRLPSGRQVSSTVLEK
jgi:opine dehydrogenase